MLSIQYNRDMKTPRLREYRRRKNVKRAKGFMNALKWAVKRWTTWVIYAAVVGLSFYLAKGRNPFDLMSLLSVIVIIFSFTKALTADSANKFDVRIRFIQNMHVDNTYKDYDFGDVYPDHLLAGVLGLVTAFILALVWKY